MKTFQFPNMHLWRMYLLLLLTIVYTHCSAEAKQENGSQGSCPQHWVDGTLTGLGCLLFNSTTTYTWEEANNYCQAKENATLVEIWTSPQSDSIASELMLLEDHEDKGTWWTGGTDIGREGDW